MIYEPLSAISPHLSSPVGEGQIPLAVWLLSDIINMSNQPLPYGGEREGAEVQIRSNLSLSFGKAMMGYPTGENERGWSDWLKWLAEVIGRVLI